MTLENITNCPVCEHQLFNKYLTAKDYTVTGEEFSLIKCKHCNFIITSPRPDRNSIAKYYQSDNYISHSGKSTSLFDKLYHTARRFSLGWKHELIHEHFPKPKRILDYGCGTGEFLNHMKIKGWNVLGLEPNQKAREKANELIPGKVIENIDHIKTNSIEVITLWHVLEHIHDLNSTIQKLKGILINNGILVIAVPNPNCHDSHYYRNEWAGYDVPRHLWHFTQDAMRLVLKRHDLKIIETKPMKLDSYYVSLLSEGYKNPNQLKLLSGIKAFKEGVISNLAARTTKEYSSLIYIVQSE